MEFQDYFYPPFIYYNNWEYLTNDRIVDPGEMCEIVYEIGNGDYYYERENFSYDINLIF